MRSPHHLRAPSLLAAALALACSSPDGLTSPRSFVVQGKLSVEPGQAPGSGFPEAVPPEHAFTLRIDPAALTLTVGADGDASTAPVRSAAGITFETTGPIELSLPGNHGCGSASVVYERVTATVRGDGVAGTGTGKVRITGGDVGSELEVALAFTGALDRVPPNLGADRMNFDPLGELYFPASEPLPPSSAARLVGAPGLGDVALQGIVAAKRDDVVSGFRKPDGTALAWDASYELVMAEPRTDLAGNRLEARNVRLSTGPAPALLAASNLGFEEADATVGGLAVVDAGFLPPIAGQRSLFLAPGSGGSPSAVAWNHRFRVRLAVPVAATTLSFAARPVSPGSDCCAGKLEIRAAAPGGPITEPAIDWKGPLVRLPIPGGELYLGAVREVALPLSAGHGPEVLLDINNLYPGCGALPSGMGLLIDDLRVE